ncbi:MAG: pyridine nucleotide-disulfide oxidoreductase, partial [Gammaproteobacteria bacterium]|nr:pyridine nucleotide-disulfide oxidoreductase [Gammaproteobacteria bacterium]
MHKSKLLIFSLFLLLIAAAAYFDLYQSITLENFKAQQTEANNWVTEHPFIATISYLAIYIIVTAINIPGAAAMTLIAGALFGIIK